MSILGEELDLDIDCDEQLGEFIDDGEQNLEDEANAMLRIWNRDEFMKDVEDDLERKKQIEKNESESYYDGEADFDDIVKNMDPIDGSEQVFIKILDPNPSGKPIRATHTLLFDRIGYLEHQYDPFESSIHDGKPSKLSLIEGPIIAGLLEALITMREGESANIMIRPSMAYGRLGVIPLIPEEATLFYHVKVHKVWDESQLNELLNLERSHLTIIPVEQKVTFVEEHKEIANKYLRDDQPREAVVRYKAAIKCLDELPARQIQESEKLSELMITLLQNASIAFNKMKMYKAATNAAKRALFMNPKNVKAYYQLAKARIGLCDYTNAVKWIEKASKLFPDTSVFDHLKLELDFQYREEARKSDELLKKMSQAYV